MTHPGVEVLTFGCRLNAVESETIRDQARRAGLVDVTIVNSCAVTAEAVRQARQAIRRAKRDHPEGRVIVTGCASETDGVAFGAMAEVDAVVPNARKTAAEVWDALRTTGEPRVGADVAPSPSPVHTRGFVEVQNGCDHRCTFCIIPFGRGASRSRDPEDVVGRVRALVMAGAREVVLTGVDVTSYGADLSGRPTLGRLVRAILAAVPELPRLRLSSLDCIEADPDLIGALAEEPRLMPHLHLSLQAGADLILKRMKRRHGRAEAIGFCRSLRVARPDIVFGADFIAGFPTETDDLFAETLDLVEECGLTFVHVFPFSARPGTPAARMPAVPGTVIRERAARLRALGDRCLAAHLASQVGRTLSVLTERGDKGHAADFSAVRLPSGTAAGQVLAMTAIAHDGRSLMVGPDAPARQGFGNQTYGHSA